MKTLNLNNNLIGSKGIQLLCESLKDHPQLESLFINDNGIDTDSASAISKLLSCTS